MAGYDRSVQIAAAPAVVWSLLEDVEKWPEWTPSIVSVARQEAGALGLGSTAKVKSKGFPEGLLTVTEFSTGRSFSWEGSGGPGMRVSLRHAIEPDGAGSRVTLSMVSTGPSAAVFGWLAARMARRNIDTEAECLARRAEETAAG